MTESDCAKACIVCMGLCRYHLRDSGTAASIIGEKAVVQAALGGAGTTLLCLFFPFLPLSSLSSLVSSFISPSEDPPFLRNERIRKLLVARPTSRWL